MMNFFTTKEQNVYFIFPPIPIFPFSTKWNLKGEKVTKEHLKLFLEDAFFYNFSLLGNKPSSDFYSLDEKDFTFLSDFISIHLVALNNYLLLKGKMYDEGMDDGCYKVIINSSLAYKPFSHLITSKNFSFLLEEQFRIIESCIFPYVYDHYSTAEKNLLFFSSKEEEEEIKKNLISFEIEDKELFFFFVEEVFKDFELDKTESRKNLFFSFSHKEKIEVKELEKYLK